MGALSPARRLAPITGLWHGSSPVLPVRTPCRFCCEAQRPQPLGEKIPWWAHDSRGARMAERYRVCFPRPFLCAELGEGEPSASSHTASLWATPGVWVPIRSCCHPCCPPRLPKHPENRTSLSLKNSSPLRPHLGLTGASRLRDKDPRGPFSFPSQPLTARCGTKGEKLLNPSFFKEHGPEPKTLGEMDFLIPAAAKAPPLAEGLPCSRPGAAPDSWAGSLNRWQRPPHCPDNPPP